MSRGEIHVIWSDICEELDPKHSGSCRIVTSWVGTFYKRSEVLFVIWWKKSRENRFFQQQQKRTEMRKKKKRNPNMSEDCCATSCEVRSGSDVLPRISVEFFKNFLLLKNQQNRPTFIKLTSLTSESTYFRAPSGLFRRLFLSFSHISARLFYFIFYFLNKSLRFDFYWSFSSIWWKVHQTLSYFL